MILQLPFAGGGAIARLTAQYKRADSRITDANFPCLYLGADQVQIQYPPLSYEGKPPLLSSAAILKALTAARCASLNALAVLTLGLENKEPHVAFGQTFRDPMTCEEFVIWVSNGYASLAPVTHNWGPITRVPAMKI